MAQVVLTPRASADLRRVASFLEQSDARAADEATQLILGALRMLGPHPLVGRPIGHGLRELVISKGKTGYLALYDYDPRADLVAVLAVRHQRELGYRG